MSAPIGRNRSFTDDDLRRDLEAKLKAPAIAAKYGVSERAVYKRINQLKQTTTTALVAPAESQQFVGRSIDALGQLLRGLGKVNLLMDACDEWLRDPDNPDAYDVGARSADVDVIYTVEVQTDQGYRTMRRKKPLQDLLVCLEDGRDEDGARFSGVEKAEYRHADPRELILKTVQEGRQTVSAAADLAKMLADARAMQEWREVVLDSIGEVAPDVRDAIRAKIQSNLVLRGLLDGPAAGWNEVN